MKVKSLKTKLGALLAISLLAGSVAIPSAAEAKQGSSVELLQEWYDDYRVNGAEAQKDDLSDDEAVMQNTYRQGQRIWTVNSRDGVNVTINGWSIGFRARMKFYDGRAYNGFVTCTHCVRYSVDKRVYSTQANAANRVNPIGRNLCWVDGAEYDCAFVQMNAGHEMSARITKDNAVIQDEFHDAKKGELVRLCGASSGVVAGQVVDTSASVRMKHPITGETRTYRNMIKTAKLGVEGDSGGLVYWMNSKKERYPIGILIGSDATHSYIMPASRIKMKMGLRTYQ